MITLRIDFLHGVYRAAEPTAPDHPEYPPAPDRVFQALVASSCEQGFDPAPLRALEGAAEVWCARVERMHNGTNYVPGAFFSEGTRPNCERPRPGVRVTHPVYFTWPEAPADLAGWLAPVLAGVGYLGRPDSPVALSLTGAAGADPATAPAPGLTRLVPDPRGEELLRVPGPGRLAALLAAHAAGRRAPPSARTGYSDARVHPSPWGEMFVLRPLRGSLHQAAQLAESLRSAAMSRARQPLPRLLHGHEVRSTDADHAAWVVLPDVGHTWARGAVLGVGMVLPRTAGSEERTACVEALSQVDRIGAIPVRRPAASESTRGIDPRTWSKPARVWTTVTPIVLDRHPKGGQSVERIITASAERAGYPAPVAVQTPRCRPFAPPVRRCPSGCS